MEILAIVIIAIIAGGAVGTAVNVFATRLPADVELLGPPLSSVDGSPSERLYIPYLGSRSAETSAIDGPNLLTQLGAALMIGAALVINGFSLSALEAIVLSSILLTILRIDWQHHLIYMLTIWPGILVALLFSLLDSWEAALSSIAAGAAAALVFLVLFFLAIVIYKRRALGLGDVFLAALIGTMVGLQFVAATLILGMFVGALGGLFLILIRVRTRKDYIPYGAYLSLAAIIMVIIVS